MIQPFLFGMKFWILLPMLRKFKLLTVLLTAIAINTFAWGPTGHRATGWIAEKYLNQKAKKNLEKLLHGKSIAMVSTWMDEVRSDSSFDYMNDWHWVTIPFGKTYEQSEKNQNGDIILTLERILKELKSRKLNVAEQLQHIKILIHLVGDIHQPLHVGGRDDKGGNEVKVSWFRSESNLHRVWDSEMIDDSRLSYTELAQSLDKPSETEIKQWQQSSLRTWAMENQAYEKNVYNIGNGRLGYQYTYLNFHIVRQRLLQAGVRLAGLLNDIYGK
jgi:hypothetical protein